MWRWGCKAWAKVTGERRDHINTNIELPSDIASGVYIVHLTAGERTSTELRVIQR
ncbi:MAG: hypothetical protein K8H89_04810 [Flavobacteriales bacterium]|jgi:hypothetical protein|nr:hypothetical protein [Flavobacteriales bacterium]